MSVRFKVAQADSVSDAKPQTSTGALARLALLLRRHPGRVKLRKNDQTFGEPMTRTEALRKVRQAMKVAREGATITLRTDDDVRFQVEAVDPGPVPVAPPFPLTGGNRRIRTIARYAAGWASYNNRRLTSLGGPVCKFISGTTTPSQHCPFSDPDGCNAWDFAILTNGRFSIPQTQALADYLVTQHKAGNISVAHLIHQDKIWEPASGWRQYAGVRHATHLHVDAAPNRPASKLACNPS